MTRHPTGWEADAQMQLAVCMNLLNDFSMLLIAATTDDVAKRAMEHVDELRKIVDGARKQKHLRRS